jgi:hypothetical protein
VEAREAAALHAEALVLGEVPVEDVHLHRGHAVEVALQDVDRDEVPAGVDQEAAPAKAGSILDGDDRKSKAARARLDEIEQRLEAP